MSEKDDKYPLDPVLYKKGWVYCFRDRAGTVFTVGKPIYRSSAARDCLSGTTLSEGSYFLYEIEKAGAWYRIVRTIKSLDQFDRYYSAPEAARSAAASGARQNERGEG